MQSKLMTVAQVVSFARSCLWIVVTLFVLQRKTGADQKAPLAPPARLAQKESVNVCNQRCTEPGIPAVECRPTLVKRSASLANWVSLEQTNELQLGNWYLPFNSNPAMIHIAESTSC